MTSRKTVAVALSALLLVGGLTGVAVAADGAAPGEGLYGVDLALEAVGIGDGHAGERIAEAAKLAADGNTAEALAHAAEAVVEVEGDDADEASNAADALLAAADEVQLGNDNLQSQEVRDAVAEMLRWMAEQFATHEGLTGRDFGQGVADMARGIAGPPDSLPDAGEASDAGDDADNDGGPPEGVPPGPPVGVPGRP